METILAGHYQIVRHLGGGGFGQTFLAKDIHLPSHPLCVVKQLKPQVSDPAHLDTSLRLFNQEAQTLYRLGSHDQIPRLLAHFEQDQEFYLVQEYIEGQPLSREIIPGETLSETYTISLLQDVLQVLAFVHRQHVIHRDIKPANLIRRHRDYKVVLIDFGAVKEVRTQTGAEMGPTSMTIAIGSPGYMPCEQQSFKPHFSSDVYAVGMVAMEALTGLRPKAFPRDPATDELSYALLKDYAVISPELGSILDKMVRYDYRQRYPTAAEALRDLEAMLGQGGFAHYQATPDAPTTAHSWAEPPPERGSQWFNGAQNLSRQEPKLTPPPSQAGRLPPELKGGLEKLLTKTIGPIASFILQEVLEQPLTDDELVEQLSLQVAEKERSRFRDKAHQILQQGGHYSDSQSPSQSKSGSRSQSGSRSGSRSQSSDVTIPPTATPTAGSAQDPTFLKRCEQELVKMIGPIAPLIVRQTLAQQPSLSQAQLVELLAQNLPNPEKMAAFRRALSL